MNEPRPINPKYRPYAQFIGDSVVLELTNAGWYDNGYSKEAISAQYNRRYKAKMEKCEDWLQWYCEEGE